MPAFYLKHISDSYIEYRLIEVAYKLVFHFEIQHQLIGNVHFGTTTEVYTQSCFMTYTTEIPSCESQTCQRINTDIACHREKIVNIGIEVELVNTIVFEEIVHRRFQTDVVRNVILILM